MISLHKQLAAALTPTDKTLFQRQIASTDHQIDTLIYGLYGLSEEEIRVVDGQLGTLYYLFLFPSAVVDKDKGGDAEEI